MSAIHEGPRLPGSYRKQQTKIKVLVHSHGRPQPMDVSDDAFSCTLGKQILGMGQANVALVPRVNYLNTIFPNDYVNIYFDKSDGHGWVRTFFGLVDRVEENWDVGEDGTPRTLYYIICSDFSKIFEKTNYYTNPHLHNRDDFVSDGVGNPVASVSLMSNGLLMKGGPSDIVCQIIFSLLGFSGQFSLPESYVAAFQNTSVIEQNRQLRLNTAENLMNSSQESSLPPDGLSGLITSAQAATPQVSDLSAEQLASYTEAAGASIEDLETNPDLLRTFLEDNTISGAIQSLRGGATDDAHGTTTQSIVNIARGAIPGRPPTVLDLINIGTFVERASIDGYTFSAAIPNYNGPIINIMRSFSNDIVNELFFDLRPVSSGSGGMEVGSKWSTDPDELGGNVNADGSPYGVQYVPAMIMREFPFSTVESVDASGVTLTIAEPNSNRRQNYGVFPFGPIFSNAPNVPGRHVITVPNINVIDRAQGRAVPAYKHLDVATISSADIKTTTFGRSDTDHINLIGLTSDSFHGQAAEYYMKDLSPIITPIHVAQHGLRVRILNTRYARYSPPEHVGAAASYGQNTQQTPPTTANAEPTESPDAQPTPAPAEGNQTFDYSTWHPPTRISERHPNTNNPIINTRRLAGTRWGYVRGGSRTETRNGAAAGSWRMHHGIDFFGTAGNPVYAIGDGVVERVYRNGEIDIYGVSILIRHPGARTSTGSYTLAAERNSLSDDLWSYYAHLGQPRFQGPGGNNSEAATEEQMTQNRFWDENDPVSQGIATNSSTGRPWAPGDIVRSGDLIGYLGWTAGRRQGTPKIKQCGLHKSRAFSSRGSADTHLHFEIDRQVEGKHFPSRDASGPAHTISMDITGSRAADITRYPDRLARVASIDPVVFFEERGINLFTAVVATSTGDTTVDEYNTEVQPDDAGLADREDTLAAAGADDQAVSDAALTAGGNTGIQGGVDSTSSRNVMARWILLQDHWFQHNLEYLSGSVIMARGAPEIRVGYRLDITDRNLSAYIEAVEHVWKAPTEKAGALLSTTLQVTRGQPNNPYPAFILPRTSGFAKSSSQRFIDSRLSKYFVVPDPLAVKNALLVRHHRSGTYHTEASPLINDIDVSDTLDRLAESYLPAIISPSDSTSKIDELRGTAKERDAAESVLPSLTELDEAALNQILFGDPLESTPISGSVEGQNIEGLSPNTGLD